MRKLEGSGCASHKEQDTSNPLPSKTASLVSSANSLATPEVQGLRRGWVVLTPKAGTEPGVNRGWEATPADQSIGGPLNCREQLKAPRNLQPVSLKIWIVWPPVMVPAGPSAVSCQRCEASLHYLEVSVTTYILVHIAEAGRTVIIWTCLRAPSRL